MRGADHIDANTAWEVVCRRPVKDGEAQLLRTWSGRWWRVDIAPADGSAKEGECLDKEAAVNAFWGHT
jgi:hypothetical protein